MNPKVLELAQPFPDSYVKSKAGHSYVEHSVVRQRLIHIFGEPPQIEILREIYEPDGTLTGVVMRLTVPGLKSVEECGECDNPQSKTNGARAKDACSDAIKRCAMSLGLGLHLWAQENYFLFDKLSQAESPSASPEQRGATSDDSAKESAKSETTAPKPSEEKGSREPQGSSGGSPTDSASAWFEPLVTKYGASDFCKVATKLSTKGTVVTNPAQTAGATEKQRSAIAAALAESDWSAERGAVPA